MDYIITYVQEYFENEENKICSFEILNPDYKLDSYAGEQIQIDDIKYIYRSYNSWSNFAQILKCKMMTPELVDSDIVKLSFYKLDTSNSFHKKTSNTEKYGSDSLFSKINKNEEPSFIYYYKNALENVAVKSKNNILNLGINSGDEFETLRNMVTKQDTNFVGIDFSSSAINKAKKRFNHNNYTFYCHDINNLKDLSLDKFDLIISIGTLQSSGINLKERFMDIFQNYLEDKGSIILGFPNCRWYAGEMVYGAKVPNYNFSEMSILYNDVIFCKKYLQQKKYRVTLTGKDYIFLTATSIKK